MVDGNGMSNSGCFLSGLSYMGVESLRCDGDNSEWNTTLFRAISRHLRGKTEVRAMGRPIVK